MDLQMVNELSAANRRELYEKLRDVWDLGANVIVGWRGQVGEIALFYLPIMTLPYAARQYPQLLARERYVGNEARAAELAVAGCMTVSVPLSFTIGADRTTKQQVEAVIRPYTVTHSECRGVALFDMVRFSRYSAFARVAQINILAYHINLAAERVAATGLPLDLSTSTTGDGFYVWNRKEGIEADLALFYVASLTLAYNRVAMLDFPREPIPALRCAFDFGEQYEYYQASGTKPDTRGFIVGDVTIRLARLVEAALPKQFLVGDTLRTAAIADAFDPSSTRLVEVDSVSFFAFAQSNAQLLDGMAIGDAGIERIKVYLTGDRVSESEYTTKKYVISDKHGMTHRCFNARFIVKTSKRRRVFTGLATDELANFTAARAEDEDIQIRVV